MTRKPADGPDPRPAPLATTAPATPVTVVDTADGPSAGRAGLAHHAEGEVPAAIGRFRVLHRIGAGGMGVVYAGWDPELDRKVAIKVLRDRGSGANRRLEERLRREAQALARLSDPRVVTVHDVGTDDGTVYLVMQYVDGTTLDQVLERRPPVDEVVALFAAAGRGLAAAHAAGIVHRDFKPHNVLVAEDGSVRVTDFGLARAAEDLDLPTPATRGSLDEPMTRGELVGTPAYMAPEQFRGGPLTAATDQFSFCVALWEGLYGRRPFAGESVDQLRAAVLEGRRLEPVRRLRRPRGLHQAVVRGLAVAPGERHASMTALLRILERRRARGLVPAALAGAVVAATAAVAVVRPAGAADPCARSADAVDAVWHPALREGVEAALARGPRPYAAATAALAATRLDEVAASLRGARVEACRATHVRREQSQGLLDRRMLCLDRAVTGLRVAAELLAGPADADQVDHALDVVGGIDEPAACSGARLADAVGVAAGADDELVAEVLAVVALTGAGRHEEALRRGEPLRERVAGDPDLASRLHYDLAVSQDWLARDDAARRSARLAGEVSAAAGLDLRAARAWSLAAIRAAELGDLRGAEDLLAAARASAARSGEAAAGFEVELAAAQLAMDRGEHAAALAACQRLVAAAGGEPASDPEAGLGALGCLADALAGLGRTGEAAAPMGRRAEVLGRTLGAEHPRTLEARLKQVTFRIASGERAELATWRAELATLERVVGPRHAMVMHALSNLVLALNPHGNDVSPEALDAARRALALGRELLAPDSTELARLHELVALAAYPLGDHAATAEAYRAALAIYEQTDDPGQLGRTLYNYAGLLQELGRCDDAVPLFRRAEELSRGHAQLARMHAITLAARGACEARRGRYRAAQAPLEEALALLDAQGEVTFAAQTRWELADVKWRLGARAQARAIAERARDTLLGASEGALRRELEAWLAAHPGGAGR